jgi:L-asparagine transporter-like permease
MGAPITTVLAILFLSAVLVSTNFIAGLTWTWEAGVPFFAGLLIIFFIIDRRTGGRAGRYDPLQAELSHRDNSGEVGLGSEL